MMTVSKPLRKQQVLEYYDNDYKVGDYFSEDGTVKGEWIGKCADRLGLSGEVDRDMFSNLLSGKSPEGEQLVNIDENKRSAWDLNFSAPKSVSICGLALGDGRVIEAHREAVKKTLGMVENYTKTLHGKKRQYMSTRNFCGAMFEHTCSRKMDMHLHTHVVTLNMTWNGEGYRAIESNESFYRTQTFATAIYRNEMIQTLRKLGYGVDIGKDGSFEIAGIDKKQRRHFSKRNREIRANMDATGVTNGEMARKMTREKKEIADAAMLLSKWKTECAAIGISRDGLQTTRKEALSKDDQLRATADAVAFSRSHHFEREAVKDERALTATALVHRMGDLNPGITLASVRDACMPTGKNNRLTTHKTIKRERESVSLVLEGKDALSPLINDRAFVSEYLSDYRDENGFSLLDDQRKMAEFMLSGGDRALAVEGKAGAGKTFALNAVRDTLEKHTQYLIEKGTVGHDDLRSVSENPSKLIRKLERRGILKERADTPGRFTVEHTTIGKRVGFFDNTDTQALRDILETARKHNPHIVAYDIQGLSGQTKAVNVLAEQSHIPSRSIQKFLMTPPDKPSGKDTARQQSDAKVKKVWVVDEAGMLDTESAYALLKRAKEEDARLILIGDRRQLKAINAGDPFVYLQEKGMDKSGLSEIFRQKDLTLLSIVKDASEGKTATALLRLDDEMAGVIEIGGKKERYAALVNDFMQDPENTVILSGSNKARKTINPKIRASLKERGALCQKDYVASVLCARNMTDEMGKETRYYTKGDILYFPLKDKEHNIAAKTYATVANIDVENNTLSFRVKDKDYTVNPRTLGAFQVYTKEKRRISEGERIIFTTPDNKRGIANSEQGTVTAIHSKSKRMTVMVGDKKRHLSMEEPLHIDHGYAITVYKSQGSTFNRSLMLADTQSVEDVVNKNLVYVGMSRAKWEARVYTDDKETLIARAKQEQYKASAIMETKEPSVREHAEDKHEQKAPEQLPQRREMEMAV